MNLYSQLKTKLNTWTGLQAHPLKKPEQATLPCIVFKGIGTHNYITHQGNTDLATERVMITILANDYPTLRGYVNSLESNLIANSTDFAVAIPGEIKNEDVDEDGINFYMRDFFITYNA
jgi:hypothetical protein